MSKVKDMSPSGPPAGGSTAWWIIVLFQVELFSVVVKNTKTRGRHGEGGRDVPYSAPSVPPDRTVLASCRLNTERYIFSRRAWGLFRDQSVTKTERLGIATLSKWLRVTEHWHHSRWKQNLYDLLVLVFFACVCACMCGFLLTAQAVRVFSRQGCF